MMDFELERMKRAKRTSSEGLERESGNNLDLQDAS